MNKKFKKCIINSNKTLIRKILNKIKKYVLINNITQLCELCLA